MVVLKGLGVMLKYLVAVALPQVVELFLSAVLLYQMGEVTVAVSSLLLELRQPGQLEILFYQLVYHRQIFRGQMWPYLQVEDLREGM